MAEIDVRLFRKGRSVPFLNWLDAVKSPSTVATIRARLNRVRLGNFGDCRAVGGGVSELRIDTGPGYRIYFGRHGNALVILLSGGSKRTQVKDIQLAKQYWKEYRDAQESDREN